MENLKINFPKMKTKCSIESLALLQALAAERNLSSAADKVGIPVSTASRYLGELREYFEDPLFSRCREGLIPTRRARSLASRVGMLLAEYSAITEPEAFNLKKAVREVFIGCVDNAPFSLFPHLAEQVQEYAPGVTLTFLPISGDRYELLAHNDLDFVISPMLSEAQSPLHALPLGVNRYVLVCGSEHPLASLSAPATDEDVCKYPFIDIIVKSIRRRNLVLREARFPNWKNVHSAVRTYFFLSFVNALAKSDFLMVLPERTALALSRTNDLKIVDTATKSLTDEPQIIWHDITHRDPLMQWLRGMFVTAAKNAV